MVRPKLTPGGRLMKASRLFSLPKPLGEPQSSNARIGDHKSPTMTKQYPQYQAITSPLSSREKGDWGFKRPLPLKSTLTTSTPLIRVKQVDSIESVTDFASAADHALSLEKFQEMRIAMSIPKIKQTNSNSKTFTTDTWHKSVFEEDLDFTERRRGRKDDKRWRFKGPWLARMTEGEFTHYLERTVRPKRAAFKLLLLKRLVWSHNNEKAQSAMEQGTEAPERITEDDVTPEWYTEYVRSLRNDRVTLYGLVSKFLDLAPLGKPIGIMQNLKVGGVKTATESPYGESGPPPSHPSAGISYLRTNSFMANHPLYGPQKQPTPTLARVVYPRQGPSPAKLGVGGFVADSPPGDNEFNNRYFSRQRISTNKKMLTGISHLDTTTYGGAKAYVSPETATVDPSGRVVVQLREAEPEAQLIAKEAKGRGRVYDLSKKAKKQDKTDAEADPWRKDRVTDELIGGENATAPKGDAVSSSRNYGLDDKQ